MYNRKRYPSKVVDSYQYCGFEGNAKCLMKTPRYYMWKEYRV